MHRRRLLILIGTLALGAAVGWVLVVRDIPKTPEEEIFSSVLRLAIAGIRSTEDHVLVEFRGWDGISDASARKRIIRLSSPGRLTLVDIYPKKLEGTYRSPKTGARAHEVSITLESWRSSTEVVVSTSFISAPLIGVGGTFILVKDGKKWVLKESLRNWVT